MKPIILYTRHTCPAKTLLVPYGFPAATVDNEILFTERGKPVKHKSIKTDRKYMVKIK